MGLSPGTNWPSTMRFIRRPPFRASARAATPSAPPAAPPPAARAARARRAAAQAAPPAARQGPSRQAPLRGRTPPPPCPASQGAPARAPATRPAWRATSSIECETMMIAQPVSPRRRSSSARMARRPRGSSPAIGSSSARYLGRMARMPASAARRFSPPEEGRTGILPQSAPGGRPTSAERLVRAHKRLLLRKAEVFGPEGHVLFHRLLKELIFRVLEHEPDQRARAFLRCCLSRVSNPSTSTLPDVGASSPHSCCMSVDLPEPVWPMTPRNSPSPMVSVTPHSAAARAPPSCPAGP